MASRMKKICPLLLIIAIVFFSFVSAKSEEKTTEIPKENQDKKDKKQTFLHEITGEPTATFKA